MQKTLITNSSTIAYCYFEAIQVYNLSREILEVLTFAFENGSFVTWHFPPGHSKRIITFLSTRPKQGRLRMFLRENTMAVLLTLIVQRLLHIWPRCGTYIRPPRLGWLMAICTYERKNNIWHVYIVKCFYRNCEKKINSE